MGRGERLFSFFDEFFSLLISNDNRVGVLSGDSVDELVHLFKRGGSALQCGFHRIIYIRSIHFYKIQKFLQIGSKNWSRKICLNYWCKFRDFVGGKFGFLCPFYGFFLQNDAHRKRLLDFGASRRLGMGDIFVFFSFLRAWWRWAQWCRKRRLHCRSWCRNVLWYSLLSLKFCWRVL